MKIVILVQYFPPFYGGTEIATYNIAKYLALRGHEVHVITSLIEDRYVSPSISKEKGFYIHRIKLKKKKIVGIIVYWLKILLILKKIQPDLIHSQNIGMGIIGFFAKIFNKIPYVVYARGDEVYKTWFLKKQFSKVVYNNAGAVIALNNDMKKIMTEVCNREIYVIPNGIDLDKFDNISKNDARKKLGIKKHEKIIIYVGRFYKIKGITYLIKAMDLITKKEENAKLFLIGSGEEMETIKQQVKTLDLEHVIKFIGHVPNNEIPIYMIASDVFVLPSIMEGFPNTILEAMASGLPIVATNVGGISEIIIDDKNGFLINPKNPRELSEKVLVLLTDDQLRKKVSVNNKKLVKNFSWENVVQKLEEIYSVIKSRYISR